MNHVFESAGLGRVDWVESCSTDLHFYVIHERNEEWGQKRSEEWDQENNQEWGQENNQEWGQESNQEWGQESVWITNNKLASKEFNVPKYPK